MSSYKSPAFRLYVSPFITLQKEDGCGGGGGLRELFDIYCKRKLLNLSTPSSVVMTAGPRQHTTNIAAGAQLLQQSYSAIF